MVSRPKLLAVLVLGCAAAALVAWLRPEPAPAPASVAKTGPRAQESATQPAFALPARQTIGKAGGALFAPQSDAPVASALPRADAPVQPVAPPMPYRVAGQLMQDGVLQTVLARGDIILTVREGDTLDDGYRVAAIRPDRVTLIYMALDIRQDIATSSTVLVDENSVAVPPAAAAGGQAARLRWDGPARVTAGSPFDVVLKLTSAEPVRAAPLQLRFDPELLEPVAVRAGGFFSDGLFSYRVFPNGSIVIGASGKGGVPIDAEFVIVRFKPLRPAAAAELQVAAVTLQSPAGAAIAHEQPGAFRTVVVR